MDANRRLYFRLHAGADVENYCSYYIARTVSKGVPRPRRIEEYVNSWATQGITALDASELGRCDAYRTSVRAQRLAH